jgi:ADP-heptose:LPS heptosyltransferase
VFEESFDPGEPAAAVGRIVDLRDHPLQREYWWGSAEFVQAFGALTINDILDRICGSFGIKADFARPVRLRAFPRPDVRDAILLITETDGATKHWPVTHWEALAARIRAAGIEVRRVVRVAQSRSGTNLDSIEEIVAPTPGDAIDVIASCRAVVGIDTGLTHIAAQQETPTITICRRDSVFFRPWPHCRVVRGAPCDPACVALEKTYAYNERVDLRGFQWQPRTCPANGTCLDPIEPERVFEVLQELL